ncbi:hypothetical protein GY45DRAFT_1340294 [Cubamyces sp. BRFM 1775]|nr:hypothetical protein GY45DRAFT_1340294 [Cubamyces sp. BRFM 1775]
MAQTTSQVLLVVLGLLAVVNMTFIFIALHALSDLQVAPAEREYTYTGDDYPAQLPLDLPPAGLVLTTDASHFALDADDDWGTLFPLSDGFTTLYPRSPSSGQGQGGRTFLISMVHQLHCLDVLRVTFAANRTDAAAHEHVTHCLRYLRQAVLCLADATLEPDEPGVREGQWEHASSGVGAVHRCRDWTVLRQYLDEHPAEDLVVRNE